MMFVPVANPIGNVSRAVGVGEVVVIIVREARP
jgi:hypothetical protein